MREHAIYNNDQGTDIEETDIPEIVAKWRKNIAPKLDWSAGRDR